MSTDPKHSPQALLASLRQDVEEHEHLAKLEAMSDAELEASLLAEGITPEKRAELEARVRAVTSPKVVDIRSARRWPYLVSGGVAALAVAAAAMLVLNWSGTVTVAFGPQPTLPTTAGAPPPGPELLRGQAATQCDDGHWNECLDKLNQARDMDTEAEKQSVIDLRRRATEGLSSVTRDH